MARNQNKGSQSHAPLPWEEMGGIPWPIDNDAGCHATLSERKRLGKGRGQGPGAQDLPDGRIVVMMMMMMMMMTMMMMMVMVMMIRLQRLFSISLNSGFTV